MLAMSERPQSLGEEIANNVSHGVALVERVPLPGLALLAAGGIAYAAGVVFYALDSRLRYGHAVWHGFVVTGSGCHFFAVLYYAA